MTFQRALTSIAFTALTVGSITLSLPIHADTPAAAGKQRVQVKFEWVKDQSVVSKTLTLSTTEDASGTVSLEPDKPGDERTAATIQPHINTDRTITIRFSAEHFQNGTDSQITSSRTLKPGDRVLIGGLLRVQQENSTPVSAEKSLGLPNSLPAETSDLQVYMTATLLPADDGRLPVTRPFSNTGTSQFGKGGFGKGGFGE